MKKITVISILLSFVLLFSCTKDQQEIIPNSQVDFNQQELLTKMKEASMVIAQFTENEDVQNELDQMIKMNMYNDDFVLFKDLFSPNSNDKLKSANIEKTAFETAFDNVLGNTNLKSEGIDNIKDYLVTNDLVLYIPYPIEMFAKDKRVPTISYHPLVNDSVNEGTQAIIKNNKVTGFKTVTVNDAYALKNLCYLIIPAEKLDFECSNTIPKSASSSTATSHIEIRIKKARCCKQYDGFFDGGSEIYFGNGTPLITEGHVASVSKGFFKTFSRYQIATGLITETNTLFIADWTTDLTQIVMFIYENDPVGSIEVSGTVKITHSVALADPTNSIKTATGWETNGSFKQTYKSEDAVIFHNDYPRDWFIETNSDPNAEWGEMSSDGIIVRGSYRILEYTMSITTRTY